MPPPSHAADGPAVDYYALLQVDRMADLDTLHKAYRTQAKQVHPDAFPFDSPERLAAEARFKTLQLAYETLSDRIQRAAYDAGLPPPVIPEAPRRPRSQHWEVPADPVMRSKPAPRKRNAPPDFMDHLRAATRRRMQDDSET